MTTATRHDAIVIAIWTALASAAALGAQVLLDYILRPTPVGGP